MAIDFFFTFYPPVAKYELETFHVWNNFLWIFQNLSIIVIFYNFLQHFIIIPGGKPLIFVSKYWVFLQTFKYLQQF